MRPAERILQDLGVTDPSEIDLEAIAWTLGVRIKLCELDGCEARIVGVGSRAIIRVEERSHPRRRNYSIGHELGHWQHHRGRTLLCRPEDIGSGRRPSTPPEERVADEFAADLLLPPYLFGPALRGFAKLSFRTIRELSDRFDASLPATAIRAVESRHSPSILICHNRDGRRWFTRSPDVPDRWFPRSELDTASFAFDLLFGTAAEQAHPGRMGADAWFDREEAQRYELHEHSVRSGGNEVLTLLLLSDPSMLEEWGSGQRARRA